MVGWVDALVSIAGSAASSAASTAASTYVQNKGSSGAPSASERTQAALTQDTSTELKTAADYRKTIATKAVGFVQEQPAAPIVANSNAAVALAAVLPDSSLKEFYTNMSRQQQQAQSQGPRQINV